MCRREASATEEIRLIPSTNLYDAHLHPCGPLGDECRNILTQGLFSFKQITIAFFESAILVKVRAQEFKIRLSLIIVRQIGNRQDFVVQAGIHAA
jgi:hypothetical protein